MTTYTTLNKIRARGQEMERKPANAHDKAYSEVELANAYQKGWNDAMLRSSLGMARGGGGKYDQQQPLQGPPAGLRAVRGQPRAHRVRHVLPARRPAPTAAPAGVVDRPLGGARPLPGRAPTHPLGG
jgi:hypothetical protein